MALNGSFEKQIQTNWKLVGEWTATQNRANNTSTVTLKCYWQSVNRYGAIYGGGGRPITMNIDGQTGTYSFDNSLNATQKKLIGTWKKTVSHTANGSKSLNIGFTVDFQGMSMNGTTYHKESLSKTFTLNTIPRASSISNNVGFTAGRNGTISVSRASTAFRHNFSIYVKRKSVTAWTLINNIENVATSTSTSFSLADHNKIFTTFAGDTSGNVRVAMSTWEGKTKIGDTIYKEGNVAVEGRHNVTFGNSMTVGNNYDITLTGGATFYQADVQVKINNTVIETYKNASNKITLNTASLKAKIVAILGANAKTGKLICTTTTRYGSYATVVAGGAVNSKTIDISLGQDSAPTFTADPTIIDSNAKVVAITKSNVNIVQNASIPRVTVLKAQLATPKDGSTIKSYTVTLANSTQTVNAVDANIVLNLPTLKTGGSQAMTVTATDTRGFSASITKNVDIIPYSPPVITTVSLKRKNNFYDIVYTSFQAKYSPVKIGANRVNTVLSVGYRFKATGTTTWGKWFDFKYSTSDTAILTEKTTLEDMVSESSFDFEYRLQDSITPNIIVNTASLGAGIPIFFLDSNKEAVGINRFPEKKGLDVEGNIFLNNGILTTDYNKWVGDNDGFGALDLRNSDITGINGIYIGYNPGGKDPATGVNGEGILFPKAKHTFPDNGGIGNRDDWDSFVITNEIGYMNREPVFTTGEPLWEGGLFMTANHTITPSVPIRSCPHGWALVWSRYDAGVQDDNFLVTLSHKTETMSGGGTNHLVGTNKFQNAKYLYTGTTVIKGHANNSTGDLAKFVLRKVYAW